MNERSSLPIGLFDNGETVLDTTDNRQGLIKIRLSDNDDTVLGTTNNRQGVVKIGLSTMAKQTVSVRITDEKAIAKSRLRL